MQFTLTFNLDNAAFRDEDEPEAAHRDGYAVAEILRKLAGKYEEMSITPGARERVMDVNGNAIGHVEITA